MPYSIVRYYHPDQDRNNEVVETGLTLEEAQAHCNDPATSKDGEWFDGYTENPRDTPRRGVLALPKSHQPRG